MFKVDPEKRADLEYVEEKTGITPPELLDAPEFPEVFGYLWRWFWELHTARGSSGFGPEPINYSEILSWATITNRIVRPWEVRLLRKLDGAFLEISAEKLKKKQKE